MYFDSEKAKSLIDKSKIVSFDIFDTLLIRPYATPTDVFKHMELTYKVSGFSEARIRAEGIARQLSWQEEIGIEDIYKHINRRFKDFLSKELFFEEMILHPNPQIKKLYEYAQGQQKKIVITSDMYLPKDFLDNILKKNGYERYEYLYVSSEIKKTKLTGNLYKFILNELKAKPEDVLHIGDNKYSDYEVPKSIGINAFLIEKPIEILFKEEPRSFGFYTSHRDSLNSSILLGVLSYGLCIEERNNYWKSFGFKYAGPVAYAFMNWLRQALKKDEISQVLFVARDGYTLQQVFNKLTESENFNTEYIYASRIVDALVNLDYKSKIVANKKEGLAIMNKIVNYYKHDNEKLNADYTKSFETVAEAKKFFDSHNEIIQELSQKKTKDYGEYINQYLEKEKIAMVYTCSIHLSSQNLLKKYCDSRNIYLKGYYWALINNPLLRIEKYNVSSFQKSNNWEFADWNVMEFLLTSPEPPISDITKTGPVFKKINGYEKVRSEVYPLVSEGAVYFADLIIKLFKGMPVDFTAREITEWINWFVWNPYKKDIPYIKQIKHAADANHENYIPICSSWFKEADWINKISIFGLPCLKYVCKNNNNKTLWLFKYLQIFQIRKFNETTRYRVLWMPLIKTKRQSNKLKVYLFDKIPLFKIK